MDYDFQKNHDYQFTEAHLHEVIAQRYPMDDVKRIKDALRLAREAHRDQSRDEGSPYIVHPMRVALLMMKYESPTTANMFIAALFHDMLEDTRLTEEEIRQTFGEQVLEYTLGITRYRPPEELPELKKQGKIRKWKQIMQSGQEIRAIKAFDYLDNMISWKFIPDDNPSFRKIPRWLMEAETMYLSLAEITNTTAFQMMKAELEYYKSKGYKVGNWYSDDLSL